VRALRSPRDRRTVLGDISPGHLGSCDAHEHLFLDTPAQPGEEFLEVDSAVEEAQTLADAGARSIVEWTPLGLARDLDGLMAVARATGLHVIAATGLHRDAHYAADSPYRAASIDHLVETFVAELKDRCGIIKVGASYHDLTPFEEKALAAAAAAHARVGSGLIRDQDGVAFELTESRYVGSRYGVDVDFDVELPT
jgi:predicted metal-dependent phosphotriesterase family hydrolase